jgi:hypothetical protein
MGHQNGVPLKAVSQAGCRAELRDVSQEARREFGSGGQPCGFLFYSLDLTAESVLAPSALLASVISWLASGCERASQAGPSKLSWIFHACCTCCTRGAAKVLQVK